ncbi:MAG: DegV family EDD domain-containing protein [Bacilli bacterium]|nr:DegV family EDD domain-containing protein [Bacilli bacterium]
MKNFVVSVESTCDLGYQFIQQNDLRCVKYQYNIDGIVYLDDNGEDLNALSRFYKLMSDGKIPESISNDETTYYRYFKSILEEGKNILHLTMSSGSSESYDEALKAAKRLKTEFPGRSIEVVDTLCVAGGFGLLTKYVLDYIEENDVQDLKEAAKYINNIKLKIQHIFYGPDLHYYKKRGRVGLGKALIGSLLKASCIIMCNNKGQMVIEETIKHGKEPAFEYMLKKMGFLADKGNAYNGKCIITHANALKEAEELKSAIKSAFPNLKTEIDVLPLDPVTASHCGQGSIAVYFLGCERQKIGVAAE